MLIANFYLRKISYLTLPNEMPKEILQAVGYAVFLNNYTVSKYGIPIVKTNFAFSIFYFSLKIHLCFLFKK